MAGNKEKKNMNKKENNEAVRELLRPTCDDCFWFDAAIVQDGSGVCYHADSRHNASDTCCPHFSIVFKYVGNIEEIESWHGLDAVTAWLNGFSNNIFDEVEERRHRAFRAAEIDSLFCNSHAEEIE